MPFLYWRCLEEILCPVTFFTGAKASLLFPASSLPRSQGWKPWQPPRPLPHLGLRSSDTADGQPANKLARSNPAAVTLHEFSPWEPPASLTPAQLPRVNAADHPWVQTQQETGRRFWSGEEKAQG